MLRNIGSGVARRALASRKPVLTLFSEPNRIRSRLFSQSPSAAAGSSQQRSLVTSATKPTRKSAVCDSAISQHGKDPAVPEYLEEVYWWAYLHPNAIKVFERQWLVDAILWGNFKRLRTAALDELSQQNGIIEGRTLQVACVYGDFTEKLLQRLSPTASLDVVDVAPIQIENLRQKLSDTRQVEISRQNASDLQFDNDTFDQVVLFFLLHEMPMTVRKEAIHQALRVLRPNGKLVFVDYHTPEAWNPHRYFMQMVLQTLEPFALDLWHHEIEEWLPDNLQVQKEVYFGGLYQKVVVTKAEQ